MSASYDDIMERFAKRTAPFVDTEVFTPTVNVEEYAYPSSAVRLLAVLVNGKELPQTSLPELETYSKDWRASAVDLGTPIAYTFAERDARQVRIFPRPDSTTADGGTFLFAEKRSTDIPDWLALPIVFLILAEEFAYPSDHQDLEFAKVCAAVGDFLRQLVRM